MFQKTKILYTISLIVLLFLNNCGIYKKTDARKVSPDPRERVKKNLEEGKGLRLSGLIGNKGNNFPNKN